MTSGHITIKNSKDRQNEMNKLKSNLKKYKPTNKNKKEIGMRFLIMKKDFLMEEK